MEKINWQNLPSTETPINATNLNKMQTVVENHFNGTTSMENIRVESIQSKNAFNINKLTFRGEGHSDATINYSTETITVHQYANESNETLKELCPGMVVGEKYTLSLNSNSTNKFIYIGEIWQNGTTKTITEAMLNSRVIFYGEQNSTDTRVINKVQIEKGEGITRYTKHDNFAFDSNYQFGTFTPSIQGRTTAGTANYTTRAGNYVKVGKLIFYNFRINCTLSGSSGQLIITDLPFGSFGDLHGDLIGDLVIGSIGTSVFPSKPYCTRSLGVDGKSFVIDQGDVVAVSDKNWSNNHYFYGTGFVILQ